MSANKKAKEFIEKYGLTEHLYNPVVLLLLEFKIEVLESVNTRVTKLPNLTEIELMDFVKETPTNASYVNDLKENIV